MNRKIVSSVMWLVPAIGLVIGEEAPKSAPQAAGGTPKIKFDTIVYDFGRTSQVQKVTGIFTFQNVGDGVLTLEKPKTSCGCTVAALKADVLQPGEKGELSFTLSLPRTRSVIQKQITVTCNDPEHAKTVLTVKADYIPLYDVTPSTFNFGNLSKGQSTNLIARVVRSDGKSFTVTELKASRTNSSAGLQAKAEPDPQSTNGAVLIKASIKPEGNPRHFSDVLNGYVEGSDQPAFTVNFSGRLVGDLTFTPEAVYWPVADPAKVLTSRHVIVRSSLKDKLEIKNLSSTLKDVTVESASKNEGKTIDIEVKLARVPEQSESGFIRFETNVPSQPTVDVPINITVTGKQPAPKTTANANP